MDHSCGAHTRGWLFWGQPHWPRSLMLEYSCRWRVWPKSYIRNGDSFCQCLVSKIFQHVFDQNWPLSNLTFYKEPVMLAKIRRMGEQWRKYVPTFISTPSELLRWIYCWSDDILSLLPFWSERVNNWGCNRLNALEFLERLLLYCLEEAEEVAEVELPSK